MSLKLTVKTLQQKQFQIDVDPSSKVSDIKRKIEETQGHAVTLQKLIFAGKILLDDQSLASYNIASEKDFLVLMVSKPPKPSTSSNAGSSSATVSASLPLPATAPAPAPAADVVSTASTASLTSAAPAPVPVPAPDSSLATEAPAQTASAPYDPNGVATGSTYESAVQNMMEMGFDRAQVQRAMRASFNNPERAVEYLMNGIPRGLGIEQQPAASTAPPPQRSPVTASPVTQQSGNTQNLFTAATQQAAAQQQSQQASGSASDLSFLRNQPQFQQLRQLVQANPAVLQPLLQQLSQSNPELLQLINANQPAFLQLLNDGGEEEGEGAAPPGSQYIHVTQEEKASIDRLEALGFDRALVIEAYFACDKNEEIAANYLFEHGNEEEWQ